MYFVFFSIWIWFKNIHVYIDYEEKCTHTRKPVAMLPDSCPPLALRGGSAYSPNNDAANIHDVALLLNINIIFRMV